MSEFHTCLREGKVSFGDDLNTVAEVTHLFGLSATSLPYHNWFRVPGKDNTIVCLISKNGRDGWENTRKLGPARDGRGWNEILEIHVSNKDPEKARERMEQEFACPQTSYVFWREERKGVSWYKFYGIFGFDAEATRAAHETEQPRNVYKRIDKSAPCLKVG